MRLCGSENRQMNFCSWKCWIKCFLSSNSLKNWNDYDLTTSPSHLVLFIYTSAPTKISIAAWHSVGNTQSIRLMQPFTALRLYKKFPTNLVSVNALPCRIPQKYSLLNKTVNQVSLKKKAFEKSSEITSYLLVPICKENNPPCTVKDFFLAKVETISDYWLPTTLANLLKRDE